MKSPDFFKATRNIAGIGALIFSTLPSEGPLSQRDPQSCGPFPFSGPSGVANPSAEEGRTGYVYNDEFDTDQPYYQVAGYFAVPRTEHVVSPVSRKMAWVPVVENGEVTMKYQETEVGGSEYDVTLYDYFKINCES